MKTINNTCDIKNRVHSGEVKSHKLNVIFDHDQEDGKSKTKPYFDNVEIEMCEGCWDEMMNARKLIYAYGAMGYNEYIL